MTNRLDGVTRQTERQTGGPAGSGRCVDSVFAAGCHMSAVTPNNKSLIGNLTCTRGSPGRVDGLVGFLEEFAALNCILTRKT